MYKSSRKAIKVSPVCRPEVASSKASCCPNAYSSGERVALLAPLPPPDLPVPPGTVPPAVHGGAAAKHAGEGEELPAPLLVQTGIRCFVKHRCPLLGERAGYEAAKHVACGDAPHAAVRLAQSH